MENLNILVVIPAEERHKEYLEAQAAGKSCHFTYRTPAEATDEEIQNADLIIGNVPAGRLKASKKLQWMQLNSAGADAYVVPGVLDPQTILTNSAGAYGTSVSEHMVAMSFALVRRFGQYVRRQVEHKWQVMGKVTSIENATVLVLGLGDIGGKYAEKMHALGAHVIGVRRSVREKPDYLDAVHTLEDLDTLLPKADIVAMVLPGGPQTDYLMDERRLRLMKPGAYLLNDGRGNAIDPEALKRVLRDGQLGGVGLDVTEPEPLPETDALWDFENVIITPHIAGKFLLQQTFENVVHIAGENLKAYLNAEELTHLVNRKLGY